MEPGGRGMRSGYEVAFLGMGQMGRRIAAHVLDGGHQLTIWNRSPDKADELVSRGAREAGSISESVHDVDAVVVMLYDGESVDQALDEMAVRRRRERWSSMPRPRDRLPPVSSAQRPPRWGFATWTLRSPGPSRQRRKARLTIFVGGSDQDVKDAWPLLELWGAPDRIRHLGAVGTANGLKSVVNMCLGIAIAGVSEALALGDDLDIARQVLLDALETGPFGWTLKQKRKMIESGDFTPPSFTVDLLAKDLRVALEAATQ